MHRVFDALTLAIAGGLLTSYLLANDAGVVQFATLASLLAMGLSLLID